MELKRSKSIQCHNVKLIGGNSAEPLHRGVDSNGSKSASSAPTFIAAPKREVRSGVSLAAAGSTLLRIEPENKQNFRLEEERKIL